MVLNTHKTLALLLALFCRRTLVLPRVLRRLLTDRILHASQPPHPIDVITCPYTCRRILVVPPPVILLLHPEILLKAHMQIAVPAHDPVVGLPLLPRQVWEQNRRLVRVQLLLLRVGADVARRGPDVALILGPHKRVVVDGCAGGATVEYALFFLGEGVDGHGGDGGAAHERAASADGCRVQPVDAGESAEEAEGVD